MRKTAVLTFGFLAVGAAYGATIMPVDLAGVTLPTGDISATMATCTNAATAAGQVCSPTGVQGNTYMNSLFSTTVKTNAPTPSSTNQNVTTGAGTTPFLLATQASPAAQQVALGGPSTDSAIVIDLNGYNPGSLATSSLGVFGVTDVDTMIQGNLMSLGDKGVTVTLNGLNAVGTAVSYQFVLTAGVDYRSTNSSQTISGTVAGSNNGAVPLATKQTSATDTTTACTNNGVASTGCSVNVYNDAFGGYLAASSRDYYLDVQDLVLPTVGNPFAGKGLLQSIVISSDAYGSGNSTNNSSIVFSGLSVDGTPLTTTATPEPATIGLLGAGVGLLALWSKRRSKNAA